MLPITLECCGLTDPGRARRRNEDHFLIAVLGGRGADPVRVVQSSLDGNTRAPGLGAVRPEDHLLLAVADGMGGHHGGEEASRDALTTVAAGLALSGLAADPDSPAEAVREGLADALRRCQNELRARRAITDEPPMGTTLTIAYVRWPEVHVAHAGDSRCALLRRGTLTRLTHDHTVAQQLVDAGRLPAHEAPHSPWAKVLWNAIGSATAEVHPEVRTQVLEPGDALLLSSDGLTRHVPDGAVARALADPGEAAASACERLVSAANDAGGSDNVTVLVARFVPLPAERWPLARRERPRPRTPGEPGASFGLG